MYKIIKETPVVTTTMVLKEQEVTLFEYIGLKLEARRKDLGLNVAEVARLTFNSKIAFRKTTPGISGSAISSIEKGMANPNINSLNILCDALKLHISDLFPPKEITEGVTELVKSSSDWDTPDNPS